MPSKQSFSRSAFLRACLPVVEYLFRNGLHKKGMRDQADSKSVLHLFYSLLPFKLRPCGKALLEELQNADSAVRTKQKEKASEGEKGLDVSRFSAAPRSLPGLSQASPSNPEDLENQRTMQAALIMAEDVNSAKRNRVKAELERESRNARIASNPYSSKDRKHNTAKAGLLARPVKKMFTPTTIATNVADHCPTEPPQSDENGLELPGENRIAQLLRRAEASPFRKGTQNPKVRANVRSSTCRICENICKEVSQLLHHALLRKFERSHFLCSRTCHLAAI